MEFNIKFNIRHIFFGKKIFNIQNIHYPYLSSKIYSRFLMKIIYIIQFLFLKFYLFEI